jgi:class 3 adenylate cyclase
VICPNCEAPNVDGARFCARCGSELGLRCANCGSELAGGDLFCSACGTPVGASQPAAGQERRIVTVLFADVTGSTSLGEQLDPERLREVMDAYFTAMREEIEAEGGTVEKFIGDAVMAAFGVPTAHEDDPGRALRAALRMQGRLEDVNARLRETHGVTLQIRIGVNTGEVLASVDPAPGEAMVTGDAVNAAARLEQLAEPGQIVTSERTARAARGFRFRELGASELRGKSSRVNAFVVEEEGIGPSRGVPGLRAPMVGRDAELAVLQSVYERVASEGRPHLVTIYGDAGVGKSRLMREFADWMEGLERPPTILRGRCLPYGDGVTYWPLAEILKALSGVLDTDPPDLALEKVRKAGREILTPDVSADPVRATAALAFTVGLEDPAVPMAGRDPHDVRAEVHAAWRSFFSALAAERPLVAIVEDIHWADHVLLDLLEELAERVMGPALFLCPSRPDLPSNRPGWGGGRRNMSSVALDPLGPEDAERLVHALLTIDDLPTSVHETILSRAEGNPFFLEEIILRLIDEGLVVYEAERWRATAGAQAIEIPDTVQGVLAARIDLLAPADRRALQAAAVVGRVFWADPVALLTEAPVTELEDSFRRLEARELILSRLGSSIAGRPEFLFKHILTRDVAYESLPRRDRAEAHAVVAGWIEESAGERAGEFVELLAYHYGTAVSLQAEARSPDEHLRRKAFEASLRASREARTRDVNRKAQRLADDALSIARGPEERSLALEALAESFFFDFRGDLAWRYFNEAVEAETAKEPVDGRQVAHLVGRAVDIAVRWPGSMRAVPAMEEVQRLHAVGMRYAPAGDSRERAILMANHAGWGFAFPTILENPEELADGRRDGLEAAEMAERLGLHQVASGAYDLVAGTFVAQGQYGRSREIQGRRGLLIPMIDDPLEISDYHAADAWGLYEIGRLRESVDDATLGVEIAVERVGNGELHSLAWRCAARFRLGEWDDALADFARVCFILDDRRDDPPGFTSHAHAAAGLIALLRGETTEADRLLDIVLRVKEQAASARPCALLLRMLVERGDLGGAGRLLDTLPGTWRIHRPGVEASRMEFLAVSGAWDLVPETVTDARAYAEEASLVALFASADRLEGRAAAAAGDTSTAIALLNSARERFRDNGEVWERARTELDLARLVEAEEARALVASALEVFTALGAANDVAAARAISEG